MDRDKWGKPTIDRWAVMGDIFEAKQWYPHVEYSVEGKDCDIWDYVTQWYGGIKNPYSKAEWINLARRLAKEQDRRSLERDLTKWANKLSKMSTATWNKLIREYEEDY